MKQIITITLLSLLSVGLFAAEATTIRTGVTRLDRIKAEGQMVEPNDAILEAFESNEYYHVSNEYIGTDVRFENIPKNVLNTIDLALGVVVDDDLDWLDEDESFDDTSDDIEDAADDLSELIRAELNSTIQEGSTDYSYMILGRNVYYSTLVH